MLLDHGFKIDVGDQRCWDDSWLCAWLPGVAAARRVSKNRLRQALKAASKDAKRGSRTNARSILAETAYAGVRQKRNEKYQRSLAPDTAQPLRIGGISCGSSGLA